MKTYTVIGVYAEEMQPFNWHTEAESSLGAAANAAREMCKANNHDLESANDILIVEIIEGHHLSKINEDTNDENRGLWLSLDHNADECLCAADIPEIAKELSKEAK